MGMRQIGLLPHPCPNVRDPVLRKPHFKHIHELWTTSTFFTSPITSSCTTTLAGTGIRVLGRTIMMFTADNKRLLLRRSEPLILNEGVGEEKVARM